MTKFQQFLRERTYLKGVSPRTIEWHEQSLNWLGVEEPTDDDLKSVVIKMREAGLKPASVNCRIRSINAYCHWVSKAPGEKCSPACQHPKLSKVKEPQVVIDTFGKDDVKKFSSWKPTTFYDRRLQVLVLMLADVGARISELLDLKWSAVDFDNLLVKLRGKGDKERVVPFSMELRKRLYRLQQESKHDLVFPTADGHAVSRRNVLRDVKRLCGEVGVKSNRRLLHSFRHSFATQYLRAGGNVFALQRCLGHSSLATTRVYEHLMTEDLAAAHPKVSLLA